ncbi:MAG: hypothetical protein CV087_07835 [Candidatus Brocadia sp. WS118]|nr:MAG: hypothetical protein CV087_07835 [Candidatus Brocadia sp. WS118]
MKSVIIFLMVGAVVALLTGCGELAYLDPTGISGVVNAVSFNKDMELIQKRRNITMKFRSNPDTDAWYDQRQKIAQALGDRVFDKDFSRVFDSLVLAVSTMELKVSNMERQSGFIAASGITLSPTESKAMRREAVNDWCRQNNFDPSILDQPVKSSQAKSMEDMLDFDGMMTQYEKMQKGLTFQLVKMGESQTKAKLRFSDVYYPDEVEIYYKLVWQAVDKQIFVDQNIEGTVEGRK